MQKILFLIEKNKKYRKCQALPLTINWNYIPSSWQMEASAAISASHKVHGMRAATTVRPRKRYWLVRQRQVSALAASVNIEGGGGGGGVTSWSRSLDTLERWHLFKMDTLGGGGGGKANLDGGLSGKYPLVNVIPKRSINCCHFWATYN